VDKELIHLWNRCHHCDASPIEGRRFHCETCPDGPENDLCEKCYEKLQKGEIKHPAEGTHLSILEIKDHRFIVVEGKPASLYERWLHVNHPNASGPKVVDHFVVRPIFSSGLDSVMGGYSFAVMVGESHPPVLLTALHVMDEMIKKKGIDCTDTNKRYTGRELPTVITHVDIYDVFAPNWMRAPLGSTGANPMLVLPHARTSDEEPYSDRDIAAFWLKDPEHLNPAPLAHQAPVVGDPVWLAVHIPGKPKQRTLKAVVVEITKRSLVFKYETSEEKKLYASGAPVLNKDGEVVGINIGGGKFKGEKFGHANHVENIHRHLTVPLGLKKEDR